MTGHELRPQAHRDDAADNSLDAHIEAIFERPADEGLSLALVVQHRGAIVGERYGTQPANDFVGEAAIAADSTLISWSMAKSITHAVVGILAADGVLDVDAPAPVAEWAGTGKAAITLLDLLEMRSGLHFCEEYVVDDGPDAEVSNCIEMLFGDSGPSHAAYAAGLPLAHPPGTVWNYSSGTTNIIARIIGDVVCDSPTATPAEREAAMRTFLDERLFGPTGMTTAEPKFDDAGTFVGSSFVYATARDFARFGTLYLNDGVAESGQRVLPAGWADHARHRVAVDPDTGFGYGRHWWSWPQYPSSITCHGYEGQFIVVVPERDLVLVHLGKTDTTVAPLLVERLRGLIDCFGD